MTFYQEWGLIIGELLASGNQRPIFRDGIGGRGEGRRKEGGEAYIGIGFSYAFTLTSMPSHFFHQVSLIASLLSYLEGAVVTINNDKTDSLLRTSCKSLAFNLEAAFVCRGDLSEFDLCPVSLTFEALANINLSGCKRSYFMADRSLNCVSNVQGEKL